MAHQLVFDNETELDAVFRCVMCDTLIGFNKAESSDPHATKPGAEWVPPPEPEQWMGPCTS